MNYKDFWFLRVYWRLLFTLVSVFPVYIYYLNPLFTPGRIIVLISVLVVFLLLFYSATSRARIARVWFDHKFFLSVLTLYFYSRVLGVAWSDDMLFAFGNVVFEFSQIFCCFMIGALSQGAVRARKLVVGVLCLVVVFSVVEVWLGENFLRSLASDDSSVGIAAQTQNFRGGFYRAQAFYEHPLSFAHILLILIGLVFTLGGRRSNKTRLSLIFLSMIGVFFSDSRFAMFALVAAILFVVIARINVPQRATALIITISLLPVFVISFAFFANLTAAGDDYSLSTITRIKQLSLAAELLGETNYLGVGIGDAAYKLKRFGETEALSSFLWRESVDSYVLIRALETGVISACFLLAAIFNLSRKFFLTSLSVRDVDLQFGMILAALSIFIMLFSPLYTAYGLYFWWLGYLSGISGTLKNGRE